MNNQMDWPLQAWMEVRVFAAFIGRRRFGRRGHGVQVACVVGLVESFLYGAYAGLVYVPTCYFPRRRWGGAQP